MLRNIFREISLNKRVSNYNSISVKTQSQKRKRTKKSNLPEIEDELSANDLSYGLILNNSDI